MDLSRVYRKTRQGEEALKGRTRLHGQRLRSVLILVDGHATAKELCDKVPGKYRPSATLDELEQLGLIETVGATGAPENVPESPPVVANTVAAAEPAAAQAEAPPAEPVAGPEATPVPAPESAASPPTLDIPETEPAPPSASTPESEPVNVVPAEKPAAQEVLPVAKAVPAPSPEAAPEPQRTAVERAIARAAEETPELDDDLDLAQEPEFEDEQPREWSMSGDAAEQPQSQDANRTGTGTLWQRLAKRVEPLRRLKWKPRLTRPNLWWVGVPATLALIGLLAALWSSWGSYRGKIEQHASAVLGQPVHIGEMTLALFPRPALLLHRVSVGDGQLAQASLVTASPTLHGWGNADRVTVDLAVDNLTLRQRAAAALCGAARLDPEGIRRARVRAVHVSNLSLALANTVISGLRGAIEFDPASGATATSLADAEDRLRATLTPQGESCRFEGSASSWQLPLRGGLELLGLNFKGSFDQNGMQLTAFDARVSDGIASGSGRLVWTPRPSLDLRLDLGHVELVKLFPALGLDAIAHGPLNAQLQISSEPESLGKLGDALTGTGSVAVAHGSVDRFDLVEAARTLTSRAVRGGMTRFEHLTAQFHFERGSAMLRALHVDAGALQADGQISIDGRNRFGGAIHVQIRGSAGQLRVPLQVGGTLAAPELIPTANPAQAEAAKSSR